MYTAVKTASVYCTRKKMLRKLSMTDEFYYLASFLAHAFA